MSRKYFYAPQIDVNALQGERLNESVLSLFLRGNQ